MMSSIARLAGFLGAFSLASGMINAQVTVTKKDSLYTDANGNELANPGDSLRYKAGVLNQSGSTAEGLDYKIIPGDNLNFNPASVRTSPVASNDTFPVTGNVGIMVPAVNGLKLNDFDDDLSGATIMAEMKMSAMGGDVTINADGSFTYVPPPGYTGSDHFTYTLLDGNHVVGGGPSSNDATVTLNVANLIWFIDNSKPAGDGRLNTPFNSLSAFNTSSTAAAQVVYIEYNMTAYTGGIVLQDNERLFGEGYTGASNLADVLPFSLAMFSFSLPVINGSRPVITNGSGDGVTLAMNNELRGFNVGNCSDLGIDDNGGTVGSLTISELNITNASGGGFRASNGGNLAVTLGSLSSTGGPNGIYLGSCGGSFNGGTGTITNPNGIAVNIAGGTVGLTYSGNITQANNFAMVTVSGGHTTGTVTFQTGTLNATNGTGLQFNNADSPTSYNFLGTTTLNGGSAAINIINGSAGSFTFGANTSITSPADTAFAVIGGTASVTYSGSITQANNFPMVSVSGGHTTGTITFQTGTLSATNGSGLQFNNADSPTSYNFNGTVTLNGGDAGIDIVNGSAGAFTFSSNCTITNPSGTAFRIDGGNGPITYNGTMSKTGGSSAGRLVDIQNRNGNSVALNGNLTNTATGATGLLVSNNSNSAIITFAGASKTLTTGGNNAITLSSNPGATINFINGGLVINTTSGTGFNAMGGATAVTVQGTGNTITSTSGTSLNVVSTTIGTSNLNFQSISSSGGTAPGINLDNTGSLGGLIVNGDGSNTSLGGNSSGGTISGKSGGDGSSTAGIGIYLNNTRNIVLRRMTINGTNQNFAIRGTSVVNFTMEFSTVTGTNGTNGAFDEGSIRFSELTGILGITSILINGGYEDNIRVVNTTAGTLTAAVSATTIGLANTQSALELNDGLYFETLTGAAIINATVSNCIFRSAAGDLFQWNINGTGTCSLTLQSNTFSNNHGAIATGGGGVSLFSNGTANTTLAIANNTLRDAVGTAFLIVKSTGNTTLSGTFSNNTIGLAGTANSGSREGSGLKIQNVGLGTVSMSVTNSSFYQYNNFGIEILTGGGAAAMSGNMNITITGNIISNPGNNPATLGIAKNGIHLNGGTTPGDTYQICLDVGGAGALANSMVGSGAPNDGGAGGEDFRFRQRQSTTVRLPGYGGAITDANAVISYIQGRNTGSPSGSVSANAPPGGGYVGGAACNLP